MGGKLKRNARREKKGLGLGDEECVCIQVSDLRCRWIYDKASFLEAIVEGPVVGLSKAFSLAIV